MEIRKLREMTGMSRSVFASKFGISVRTLEKWEQGRSEPPGHTARMIANILYLEQDMPENKIKEEYKVMADYDKGVFELRNDNDGNRLERLMKYQTELIKHSRKKNKTGSPE